MPCFQAALQKARDEHIRKNRRDLNEFDGITDPVEALKIVHRPRKYDPLLNWIPPPKPVDQLYSDLSDHDQSRLADYAKSQTGSNRNDEAEDILLCLAAFTDARFDSCLRAFASHNLFWPSLPFHRSPPDVRDELIARVEKDARTVITSSWRSRGLEMLPLWRYSSVGGVSPRGGRNRCTLRHKITRVKPDGNSTMKDDGGTFTFIAARSW